MKYSSKVGNYTKLAKRFKKGGQVELVVGFEGYNSAIRLIYTPVANSVSLEEYDEILKKSFVRICEHDSYKKTIVG